MSDREPADEATEATEPPPGPTDHGRTGGMATREVAPEVVRRSGDDTD